MFSTDIYIYSKYALYNYYYEITTTNKRGRKLILTCVNKTQVKADLLKFSTQGRIFV